MAHRQESKNMYTEYFKSQNEWFERHANFDEYCEYWELDEEKIIQTFKEVFFDGLRRGGSWERQAIDMMFSIETLIEDYGKSNLDLE